MKKWVATFILAFAVVWAMLTLPRPKPPTLSSVTALLPGKVTPQLVSAYDTSILLGPDGSLWGWGGYKFLADSLFGHFTISQTPKKISESCDWQSVALGYDFFLALKA